MQPRTLEQVISSLGSVYDPQVQSVQQQQALLPQQLQNDESALQGQQTQAFDNILQGARRRGTGVAFGGIPLGEQAKYNATTYMPAAANLRGTYAQKGLSLQDAILGINRDRATQAQGIFENERNFFEQQRQFNEQQEFAKAQAAAQERQAAAARAAAASPTFGGGASLGASTAQQAAAVNPKVQNDYNFVRGLITQVQKGDGNAVSLILSQAKAGNARSKDIMRAFYQLQNKAIPANFRSFL